MKRRSLLQVLGLASTGTLLSGCYWESPDEWKSKLSLIVQTPQGEMVGSAVRWHQFSTDPVTGGGHYQDKGEATVVDLGNGKYLFALIQEMKPHDYTVFYGNKLTKDSTLQGQVGLKAVVQSDMYPMLVTFTDIKDPKSVKEVKPSDLAGAFGAGYSLKRITLEITDEKVTEGVVEKVLGWLVGFKGRILSPDLRLGAGLHDASVVLPIEKLNRSNFVEAQK